MHSNCYSFSVLPKPALGCLNAIPCESLSFPYLGLLGGGRGIKGWAMAQRDREKGTAWMINPHLPVAQSGRCPDGAAVPPQTQSVHPRPLSHQCFVCCHSTLLSLHRHSLCPAPREHKPPPSPLGLGMGHLGHSTLQQDSPSPPLASGVSLVPWDSDLF